MIKCILCQEGTLQFKAINYNVSIYGYMSIPVGKMAVNVCSNCCEPFFDQVSVNAANKIARKKIYEQYNNKIDQIPGTVAAWIRITMLLSRDELASNDQELKKWEQNNDLVSSEVGKKLIAYLQQELAVS